MKLMNDTSNITTIIPKIIEFPEHFIINTQLYDKQTFKPVPMKFYTDNTVITPMMLLQTSIEKTVHYNTSGCRLQYIQHNNEHNRQNIIQDKNDPSIFYVIQCYMPRASDIYDRYLFRKIQYNSITKEYHILGSLDIVGSKGDLKILYESDDYFVVSRKYHGASYGTWWQGYLYDYNGSISLLNKKTFTYTDVKSAQFGTYFLCENNDNVYVLIEQAASGSKKEIVKINLSSKKASTIWTETNDSNKGVICNPIKIGEYYYILTPHYDGTAHTCKLMKISLNTTTDMVNTELFDIDLNGFVIDSSPNSDMIYSYYVHYTLKTINTDNSTYISCLIHSVPNMIEDYNYQHKHLLIKLNDTKTSFTIVDSTLLKDGCHGSLNIGDTSHQLWYMSNSILFYNFNEKSEKMVCTYRKAGIYMQVGLDSLNRVILQTPDNIIEMLTDTNACVLEADFDKELYSKTNVTNIDTTVSFYAKNYLDEYMETNVKLTLTGPVFFKENNTKELIVSTLETGIRTVPVVITGVGSIEVIITQNT